MTRAERLRRRELAIQRALAAAQSLHFGPPKGQAGRWAKYRVLGRCGQRGCSCCTVDRVDQRLTTKRARREGHLDERSELASFAAM